jgi:hypothetical protein
MLAKDLYERDFHAWTQCNAALLRAGSFEQADIEHIAEEIEDMGKSQQRELENRLEVLLLHLLKWLLQPDRRSKSWRRSANEQRREIEKLLRKMPSLRPRLPQALPEAYSYAVRAAVEETDLPKEAFPPTCPFALDEVLEEEFFPG